VAAPGIPAEERTFQGEIDQLLLLSGWALTRTRGSHKHYRKGSQLLSVPSRRGPILIPYVRDVLRRTREEGDD